MSSLEKVKLFTANQLGGNIAKNRPKSVTDCRCEHTYSFTFTNVEKNICQSPCVLFTLKMQLKYDKMHHELSPKTLEGMLLKENEFITNLFSMIAFPERYDEPMEEEDDSEGKQKKLPRLQGDKTERASTIEELRQRLQVMQKKGNRLSYKEKLQKKSLKNRMKKKSKQEERNVQHKLIRAKTLNDKTNMKPEAVNGTETKPPKPVFNSAGNMVFSKFDFSGLGKQKEKKQEKDPKKILQNLQKQKEKLQQLEAEGEKEKAVELKEKSAWKNAIAKSQGEKVKDDPELLKKTVKRKEQQQRHSKKKWEKRIDTVKKAQEDKQKKRTDNIEKRKKDKKTSKLKKASKRGRIIPGF